MPIQVRDLKFKPFLTAEQIHLRVEALGAAIRNDLEDKAPLFIGVLDGAFIFAADLIRAADIPCEIAFVKLNSYSGTTSSGSVKETIGLNKPVEGRHVVIIEDIVDTGRTLKAFTELLQQKQPASLSIASLLLKPDALQFPLPVDYLGFKIPDKFVVGYGLDYEGGGRELKGIYQLITTE